MKQIIYTTVDDFLCDDDFIRFALDACPDKANYWASYQHAAPSVRSAYQQAYDILTHLDDCDRLSPDEVKRLRRRILRTIAMAVN